MEFSEFSESVRDSFDNVFAIHWKGNSVEHIHKFIKYFRFKGYSVKWYTPKTELNNTIDFDYIKNFYEGNEEGFPSLEIVADNLKFDCFLEYEPSISLWFNDSGDTLLTNDKFENLKSLMRDLAITFERTVYFVNEGEPTHRYFIFKCNRDGLESNYDISDIDKCAEKLF